MAEIYEVAHPYWDIKEFEAVDAQQAAEEAAERYDDNGDYPLRDGDEEFFAVRLKGCSKWQYFKARAEISVDYFAKESFEPPKSRDWEDLKHELENVYG